MTAPPFPGEPLLDEDYVGEIAMLLGADFLRRQFDAFAAELRVAPGEIEALLGHGDRSAAAERAHAVKGAALAVGARRLAAYLADLESEASAERLGAAIACGRTTLTAIARFTALLPPS